jgi:carbamate kinase
MHQATPAELRARSFPAGSMGPKIEAVCRFVERAGKMAAIGQLSDAAALLDRKTGTVIVP